MEIISEETTNLNYVLIILSDFGGIHCEHFTEYPELKISRLQRNSCYDLLQQHISGYALCVYKHPVWTINSIRGADVSSRQVLKEYIRTQLNNCYQLRQSQSTIVRGGNDED